MGLSSLTPTAKSSFIAGMGLSAMVWAMLSHLNVIGEVFKLRRWLDEDRFFDWIAHNKILTLLCTECINYGTHGIDNPDSVTFAGGATVVNVIVIYCIIWPWRKLRGKKSIKLEVAA